MLNRNNILKKIKKVLLLGSGGLRISQAGEFDYSGSQAIKALKEEGIKVILVNPNIATIQTDPDMADEVYFEPLDLQHVTKVIEIEKPDAIILSFGGQTALNLGIQLEDKGILKIHNVQVLGNSILTIKQSEDRVIFNEKLNEIGINTAKNFVVTNVNQALETSKILGFPLMVRSSFSMGGLGSNIIYNIDELQTYIIEVLKENNQCLIEECLLGWNEFEYEIIRDISGNVLTICNMENVDPMGIHTGESIVVSPSQSLNNIEYHHLRQLAIKVANHFNIIGECNIQYAFNLKNSDYRVIEINPRLSRSSALASKATGYPLAFISTKLILGYHLYELKNTVTKKTCAYFEPALDYIVVKIPRWDTHKFKKAERFIGTEMKSVGEVMAIGRSFPEALQKAVGMLNIGASDLTDYSFDHTLNIEKEIEKATDRRIFALHNFFLKGGSVNKAHRLSGIDKWFLVHMKHIASMEKILQNKKFTSIKNFNYSLLKKVKQLGFSDKSIAKCTNISTIDLRNHRMTLGIIPYVKQIDTLAGEFEAETNYLYMTYHGIEHDILPSKIKSCLIIGSGPYSIGSSVEFDWCAVNTAHTLKKLGESPIIINSNPETVSTDYDESDRLYFEPLTLERVQDIADFENVKGIIVSVGGQTANNLVLPLYKYGYNIFGTLPYNIHRAENRELFSKMLNKIMIDQPHWESVSTLHKAKEFAKEVNYPILVRPSYVLSGSAMNVLYSENGLKKYLGEATLVSLEHPVVISEFITNAKELELDGVAQNGVIIIDAISEHVENAGVHSGDATIVLPPKDLSFKTISLVKLIASKIVNILNITGPFNIQFIHKNNSIKVIECNLRASRSFPFVSKITGYNFIEIATKIMMGKYENKHHYDTLNLDYVGVKTSQFSYHRLKGANPVANVEMSSTGEVGCIGHNLLDSFYKSWVSAEKFINNKKILLSIGGEKNKHNILAKIDKMYKLGWTFFATKGTHEYLKPFNINTNITYKISEYSKYKSLNIQNIITSKKVGLIINIPRNKYYIDNHLSDGFKIRRLAVENNIPLITNLQIAELLLSSLIELYDLPITVKSWRKHMMH